MSGERATLEFKPLALVEMQLRNQETVELHPLIDYHEETGFSMGTLIDSVPAENKKSLLFLGYSVFLADFGVLQNQANRADYLTLKELKWLDIRKECSRQLLLLSKELLNGYENVFPSKNEVFEKTLQGLSEYWWHGDRRYYTLVTCWILGTYLHPIFSFYPALNLQGQRETGKSTLLDILSKTCWNPTGRETAIRGADIFRTVEGTRGTYIIDITMFDLKNDDTRDVVDLIEVGTEKGGVVRRIDKDSLTPQQFEVYSPKAIATRYELPFTVKCIRIFTEKAPKEYSQRRAKLQNDPCWNEIIRLCVRAAVKYWREIVHAYRTIEQTDKLTGRSFNYWAPILAVCKVFYPEGYTDLLSLAEEHALQQNAADRLSEVEDAVLAVLSTREDESSTMRLKDLTQKVGEIVPWVQSWHIVKSAVENLNIIKERYNTSQGLTFRFNTQKVKILAQQKSITESPPQKEEKNEEPYFKACFFCMQPIMTDDWKADEFTQNKPVHSECYEKQRQKLKGT